MFDQIKEPLDALERTLSAYDTITTAVPISEKKSLSGEIDLLQRGVTIIYGGSDPRAPNDESMQDNLKKVNHFLGGVDSIFLFLDQRDFFHEKIEELQGLHSLVLSGNTDAERRFLTCSEEVRGNIVAYYTIAERALKNIGRRKIV